MNGHGGRKRRMEASRPDHSGMVIFWIALVLGLFLILFVGLPWLRRTEDRIKAQTLIVKETRL